MRKTYDEMSILINAFTHNLKGKFDFEKFSDHEANIRALKSLNALFDENGWTIKEFRETILTRKA